MAATAALTLGVGCSSQPEVPPFAPVATIPQLMESIIAHSAEVYWDAVSIIVDEDGIHENYPQTDEQWEEVWSAAMSIAESGNLLMMAPRAVDNDAWMQMSAALVEVGVEAAAAAEAKDPDRVLDLGEQVYNVCLACHVRYIPQTE
jgi:hypothetical protein